MNKLPVVLSKIVPASKMREVRTWWCALTPSARRTLRQQGKRAPVGVLVRHVADPSEQDNRWRTSALEHAENLYEYLVNHEITIPEPRSFHICTAHPQARAALRAGVLSPTFVCPREEEACPMRTLLDLQPGSSLQFSIVKHPSTIAVQSGDRK
jgi:hypothetical protein